jgi:hypothetical protein
MGWAGGNPGALFILFFSIGAFLTGGLYSAHDWVADGRLLAALVLAALVSSLAFVLLILARILWVASELSPRG